MAFKEISLVLTTSDQDIAVVEADRQAVARLTITNNHATSARTYTIKHYKAAALSTVTVRNAFNVNALSAVDIPAISLNEGDKIIASASAASDVVISGAFHDTAKAVPFAVAGLDGVDPGYPWNFRDKTDVEEPDAVGDLNFNNAVLADVTKIALSAQSAGATNPDLSDIIESWDDNGESANRGRLLLKNRNAPAQTAEFRLTGTVTYHDATIDWYELDVEFIGGPGLSTDAELSVQFFDAGEEGAAGVSGASAMTKVDVVDTDDGDPDTDYEDGDEIDGVTLEANMLVLRASSSDPELNGVYVVPVSGAAARHTDFDAFDDLPGSEFNVIAGDVYASTKWRCNSEKGGTIDTDAVTIDQVISLSAAASFESDNALLRSDGTGTGVQASGIVVNDADDLSGARTILVSGNGVNGQHIHVECDDGNQADITSTTYATNGGGIFHGRFARGSKASPSAAQAGDIIAGIGGRAYHSGGAFQSSSPASIHWVVSENQTGSAFGSYLRFLTTPKGSTTRQERVIISDNGTLWAHDTGTFDPKNEAQTKPVSDILLLASAAAGNGTIGIFNYNDTGTNAGIRGGKAGGTPASPTATVANSFLVFVGGHGHDGTGWTAGSKALIAFKATENFTGAAQGTMISFEATRTGTTTRAEMLRVDYPSTAGQTGMMLYDVDNNTLERVTVGAADSGGSGYKVLRIPN